MSEQQSSYRQIMKATSLFGGVQVFQIIIQVIRSKFVAVLLGPTGMGIVGLLMSTLGLISGLTNFGLGTSAVKSIAEANGTENLYRISVVNKVVMRLVWITGILGAIITIILSPWLSELTFGNKDYTVAFIWISITLLFNQLTSGQMVLLQGLRKLQYLAKANLFGSLLGLFFTVPFYYFFGISGIIPVIISTAVISFGLSTYFAHKIKLEVLKVTKVRTIAESKTMLSLGFMISMSGLFSLGASYIIRIFINRQGGVAEVGLYNAGFTIIATYVGLIFTAMSTDYYPRLSAVAHSNFLSKETINQQADIAILILAPIIMIFLVFIKWMVILLYSNEFSAIDGMIYWAALGVFFKAASWVVAFVFLAKGSSKLFFSNELLANIYVLGFNLLGYYYWGLTGLGISFFAAYLVYAIQVYVIAHRQYEFNFSVEFIKILAMQLLLAILCFLSVQYLPQPWPYIVGSVIICISVWYSYKELDKRLGIKSIISNFTKNKH